MPTPKYFIPLESNPDVLNKYAVKLGATNIPSAYQFCDVFGLDDDLLAFVPPQIAAILLFPITKDTENLRHTQQQQQQDHTSTATPFYMKQTIGNACGTIGLLHCLANAPQIHLTPDSFLDHFITATTGMSPEQRGQFLEHPPHGAPSIDSIHEEAARGGDTQAPPADADIDLHFVAFVPFQGRLWELDGRKAGPVDHGELNDTNVFLKDVAAVVKKDFIEKSNGSLQFSIIALSQSTTD